MDEYTITFQSEGEHAPVKLTAGKTLMESFDKEISPIRYGCEGGVCGTCLVNILEGADHVNAPDDEEKETLEELATTPQARLACRLEVSGDIKVEYVGFNG
ncbi:MAG: (2Fe-2S)-binding protein [Halobacteriovoraceae bacterium]|jgi:ferredoxin|nr:(2Fe-2S)-binding protein [Halobacteriovoraceae bacterium]MBT5094725.1 (2Fe-2S)-binding protein [Halobacteriovoraceae bacterium]